jgi:ubiquinone/menaquinone biosynthesis C-methylase UbiE
VPIDPLAFKEGQRATWSAGDYPEIAQLIEDAAERTVELLGVAAGHRVLDVATGTGNAAIPAAQKGANVIGLDLTPDLLAAARGRATAAGVDVEWVEGDAEELPFDDGSFDRAMSVFGAMFAPRHELAASEIRRVVKTGGSFAVTGWTPEGLNGQMFKTVGKHMPPPPPDFVPPVMWGDEDYMTQLFGGDGAQLSFERGTVSFGGDTRDEYYDYFEQRLGPLIMARKALEPEGKYDALRDDLLALYDRFNEADDGSVRLQAEYLVTVGTLEA